MREKLVKFFKSFLGTVLGSVAGGLIGGAIVFFSGGSIIIIIGASAFTGAAVGFLASHNLTCMTTNEYQEMQNKLEHANENLAKINVIADVLDSSSAPSGRCKIIKLDTSGRTKTAEGLAQLDSRMGTPISTTTIELNGIELSKIQEFIKSEETSDDEPQAFRP